MVGLDLFLALFILLLMKAPFDCYAIYLDGKLISIVNQAVGTLVSYNLKEIIKLMLETVADGTLSPQCMEYSAGVEIPFSI